MATLLHIDASIRGPESVSREVTAAFTERWRQANPGGEVIYRDLAADPVPHLDIAAHSGWFVPADQRTPEQAAGVAVSQPLVDELFAADVILLGVPMYNWSVPDNFKTWLDRIINPVTKPDPETGKAPLAGRKFVVVLTRGGGYGPGTPREDWDFQETYLTKIFTALGVLESTEFVRAELTLAKSVPAMADLIPLGEQSLADAHSTVRELAAA